MLKRSRPILTDAMNHTGIATVTYLNTAYPNGSAQQVGRSLMYVSLPKYLTTNEE